MARPIAMRVVPDPIVFDHLFDVKPIQVLIDYDNGTTVDISSGRPNISLPTEQQRYAQFNIVDGRVASPVRSAYPTNSSWNYIWAIRPLCGGTTSAVIAASCDGVYFSKSVTLTTKARLFSKFRLDKVLNPDTVKYYLEQAENESFTGANVLLNWGDPEGEYSVEAPENKQYFYRSKARNSDLVETNWSNTLASYKPEPVFYCKTQSVVEAGGSRSGFTITLEFNDYFKVRPEALILNPGNYGLTDGFTFLTGTSGGTNYGPFEYTSNYWSYSIVGKTLKITILSSMIFANVRVVHVTVGREALVSYGGRNLDNPWRGSYLV